MPSLVKVARRIWWFTVSNAVDRLSRIRIDERDKALAAWRDSVTVRRGLFFEERLYSGSLEQCLR